MPHGHVSILLPSSTLQPNRSTPVAMAQIVWSFVTFKEPQVTIPFSHSYWNANKKWLRKKSYPEPSFLRLHNTVYDFKVIPVYCRNCKYLFSFLFSCKLLTRNLELFCTMDHIYFPMPLKTLLKHNSHGSTFFFSASITITALKYSEFNCVFTFTNKLHIFMFSYY